MHPRYEDNLKVLEMLGEDINEIFKGKGHQELVGLSEKIKSMYKLTPNDVLKSWHSISEIGIRAIEIVIENANLEEEEIQGLKSAVSELGETLDCVRYSFKRREKEIDPKYIEKYEKLMDRPAYVDEDRIKKVEENEAAKVAARWWRKAIDRPKFDNGDKIQSGGLTMMLAMMLTTNESDDKLDKFQATLEGRIKEQFFRRNRVSLYVDYGPDGTLADSAIEAEVSGNNFPLKTNMRIDMDKVSVSAGSGAESKIIFITPERAQKTIEQLQESISTRKPKDYKWEDSQEEKVRRCESENRRNFKEIEKYSKILENGGYNLYSDVEQAKNIEICEE